MKARKVSRALEKRRAARAAAMPEVKRLVKRYGAATIANCLGQLRDADKAREKLAALRREVAQLQRRIR